MSDAKPSKTADARKRANDAAAEAEKLRAAADAAEQAALDKGHHPYAESE